MLRTRLIPVLLLKNGLLVRSEAFSIHQIIGNPLYEVQRFNEWNVDELIYLDITREGEYDLGRNDHKTQGFNSPLEILELVAKTCFMPLTWGGRIRSIEDMRERFLRGADKITLNSAALANPSLIETGAKVFGNQAIVLSIDVQKRQNHFEVMTSGGQESTGREVVSWAIEGAERGAGEILLQSVDQDGAGNGYDLDLIQRVAEAVRIPIIACSGVGRFEDYSKAIVAGASAAAAANIWHFKEMSDRQGKRAMARAGIHVRL